MSMVSGDQPRRRARMTSRAGGTQDSGAGQKPGALTARGGMGYTAPIPSPRQMPRADYTRLTELPPRIARELPRNRSNPESLEEINSARIFFGPGALASRGGSGYQGANRDSRREAARMAALQSVLFDQGTPMRPISSQPRMSDVPNMSQEEIDMYNRPAMDINDAFFGPDRKRFDVVEFLMGLMGRR